MHIAKKAPSKPVESLKPRYKSEFEEFQKLLTDLILEQKVRRAVWIEAESEVLMGLYHDRTTLFTLHFWINSPRTLLNLPRTWMCVKLLLVWQLLPTINNVNKRKLSRTVKRQRVRFNLPRLLLLPLLENIQPLMTISMISCKKNNTITIVKKQLKRIQ